MYLTTVIMTTLGLIFGGAIGYCSGDIMITISSAIVSAIYMGGLTQYWVCRIDKSASTLKTE